MPSARRASTTDAPCCLVGRAVTPDLVPFTCAIRQESGQAVAKGPVAKGVGLPSFHLGQLKVQGDLGTENAY